MGSGSRTTDHPRRGDVLSCGQGAEVAERDSTGLQKGRSPVCKHQIEVTGWRENGEKNLVNWAEKLNPSGRVGLFGLSWSWERCEAPTAPLSSAHRSNRIAISDLQEDVSTR